MTPSVGQFSAPGLSEGAWADGRRRRRIPKRARVHFARCGRLRAAGLSADDGRRPKRPTGALSPRSPSSCGAIVVERLGAPLIEPIFEELAIIGVGLIGSSIARVARRRNAARRIVLADRIGQRPWSAPRPWGSATSSPTTSPGRSAAPIASFYACRSGPTRPSGASSRRRLGPGRSSPMSGRSKAR